MSSPSPASSAPRGPHPVPVLAGVVLAVAGFFAARSATESLGYGSDVHALRVVALCVPLFVGGLVAFWRGRAFLTRVVVLLVAVGLGAAAWVFVPCRPDGPSLFAAAAKRDELRARLATPPGFDDTDVVDHLGQKLESLANDYPTLGGGLRPELAVWGNAAAGAVAEKFRQTPPDDLAGARAAAEKGNRLTEAIPDTREEAGAAAEAWVLRAVAARSTELSAVPHGDWAGFDRTAPNRRALAEAFPATRAAQSAHEQEWVSWAAQGALDATAKEPPRRRREACREAEKQLLALAALEDSPGRFRAARQKLFAAAHEAARAEAREHIENRKFGLAFTVAVSHDLEWSRTTQLLTPAEQESVAALREGCRYLAKLSEKAGDPPAVPEVAPEPRGKP